MPSFFGWGGLAVMIVAMVVHITVDGMIFRSAPGTLRRLKLCLISRISWWIDTGIYTGFITSIGYMAVTEPEGRGFSIFVAGWGCLNLTRALRHWKVCPGGDKYPGGFIKRLLAKVNVLRRTAEAH